MGDPHAGQCTKSVKFSCHDSRGAEGMLRTLFVLETLVGTAHRFSRMGRLLLRDGK